MTPRKAILVLALLGLAAGAGAAVLTYDTWRPWLPALAPPEQAGKEDGHHHHEHQAQDQVQLSPQAQANLRLVVKPISLTSHWRSTQVPGQVTEFPGRSDHAVTSPVAGVVKRVAVVPWDTVKPGDELFTLGLTGEVMQSTQAELFKTARDLEINQEERQRLADVSRAGTVPATRLLELEYQQRRLNAALMA
jgi:biotin carboxyl carrier protein